MENPEIFLEILLSTPDIEDEMWPKVSRDGRWVAWTWFKTGPAADIYAVPTDGSKAPVRLTDTTENTYLLGWTPDSKAVLVAQDRDGDERYQVLRVDLDHPLEMVALTEQTPNYFIQGGQLHPNGRWLIYGANHDLAGEEIEATWLYRRDCTGGELWPLAQPERGAYLMPKLSPDGSYILYTRKDLHPAGRQAWLVDIEGREDRLIYSAGDARKVFPNWLADGSGALLLAETDTHNRLGLWESEGGSIHWLVDDPLRDLQSAVQPFGSREIVMLENKAGCTLASLLDPETLEETPLSVKNGTLIPLAPVADSQDEWVGVIYGSRQPPDVIRFSLDDPNRQVSLSTIWERTKLEPNQLAQAEDFHWISDDGLAVHGWLYHPQVKPKGTVVYIHGGPTWHSQDWLNLDIQFFTHMGYNVLDPNYRGSTGYGLAFQNTIRQDGWGGREQADIRSGIEALIEAGIAQAGKVAITGTSYGGYSSWFAITHFPPEITAAAAPICGMTDLVVDYETTRPDIRPYSEEMMGGSPAQVPERYYERSPIHFVDRIQGRLLIIQGGQDPNVTPKNVSDVIIALEKAGVPYELLTFDDEGHGISKPKNRRAMLLRQLAFFEEAFTHQT